MTARDTEELIAVVGMGVAVPGASSPAELWRTLNGTCDAFSEPGDRFRLPHFWSDRPEAEDRTYARRAGYLHDFRPHPGLAEAERDGSGRDDAARWLRHALLQAREHVRTGRDRRCAAYVGAWPGGSQSLVESVLVDTVVRALDDEDVAERVRRALLAHYRHALPLHDADPPDAVVRKVFRTLPEPLTDSCVVDTACASSLYAVDLGVKALLDGTCDIAYCGGVTVVDPTMAVMFAKLRGLSPRGRVRAFTEEADGTLFSDGAGIVALKTLRRAEQDGDTVHGVLLGFGGAADGRGKSISAPNPDGQRRAIERARAVNSVTTDQTDWIVAHGTGTPAGDGVESQVLSALGPASGQICTSNKPVLGHTGWTAGVVSLIHALLGLRHGWIPAQLGARPAAAGGPGNITVPAGPLRFRPGQGGRRTVGVSAFGFGGTNAHLLVTDRVQTPGLRSAPPRTAGDDMVLVAWAAHLPGAPPPDALRRWLRGSGTAPAATFPEPYPAPPPAEARLSARTLPVVDAAQLMGLQAAARFVTDHGELWADLRETTGVIAAHTGMPRGLVGTALRCYAQDTAEVLAGHAAERGFAAADRELEAARRRHPACTEDSQAGALPNVIASRLAARYDLHGPTLAVDSGVDGTLTALRVAGHYLRTGELDLALVLAVNGNGTAANAVLARSTRPLAEGAFLLAVTTARRAAHHGWRPLARLTLGPQNATAGGTASRPGADGRTPSGERPPEPGSPGRSYLAADHAVALLRAVESGAPVTRLPGRHHDVVLGVHRAVPSPGAPDRARPPDPVPSPVPDRAAPPPRLTSRYVRAFAPAPRPAARLDGLETLPSRGLVLAGDTAMADRIRGVARDSGSTLLDAPADEGSSVSAQERAALEAAADGCAPHLTVVCDLAATPLRRVLALHEMTFLALRRMWPRWRQDSSLTVVLTDPTSTSTGDPFAALFEGLVKSVRWERPDAFAATVTTDQPLDTTVLAAVAAERAGGPASPPVVRFRGGERRTEVLCPAPVPPATPAFPLLPDDAVGIVTGGAGGMARELLTALPDHLRPRLWLLGRTPLDDEAPTATDGNGGGPDLPDRATVLREIRREHPGLPTRDIVTRADLMLRQHQVRRALRSLRARFGAARVRYLSCDLTDRAAVDDAVGRVLRTDGRVDLVVHAAGQVASTLLPNKSPGTFRAVRDTKVLGHRHLTDALADRPPRLWCNIGSYSGAAGAPGDTDYASANAYLAAVADTAAGTAHLTVGFTMWGQTGMGADALFQEHVAHQGHFTPISSEEGAAQFTDELRAACLTGGAAVYLGPAERRRLQRHQPGLVRPDGPAAPGERRRPGWWSRPGTGDTGEWSHRVDPHEERHLFDHLVGGKPTTPATFLLDLAAQAAEAMVPEAFATGFRDARFDAFVRPCSRAFGSPLRIRARLSADVSHAAGPQGAAVEVSVHSDLLDPSGRMRRGALRHFRTLVLLDRSTPAPPRPRRPADTEGLLLPASDPYAAPDAVVSLRGPFRNLSDCRVGAGTAQGTWTPSLTGHPWLRTMTTPALFLCAALRTLALRPASAGHQPLPVPRSIARIDLYTAGANDHDLLLRHGHGLRVASTADGTCHGVTPGGEVLFRASGIDLVDLLAPSGGTPAPADGPPIAGHHGRRRSRSTSDLGTDRGTS
jgi:acetyl-CoA acetyltransferase